MMRKKERWRDAGMRGDKASVQCVMMLGVFAFCSFAGVGF